MKEKYLIRWTSRFKKDFKLAVKQGRNIGLLKFVVGLIAKGDEQERLAKDYDDHALSGEWKDYRELHLCPDWLLIYTVQEDVLVLTLSRTGTHAKLFGK